MTDVNMADSHPAVQPHFSESDLEERFGSINDVILETVVKYGSSNGEETRPNRVKMTAKENALTFATFVVMGTAAMAFWNTLIGCLYSVQAFIFPDQKDISDTITAVYTTMSLIVTATLIRFQIINHKFLIIGAAGFALSALGIALVCQVAQVRAFNWL